MSWRGGGHHAKRSRSCAASSTAMGRRRMSGPLDWLSPAAIEALGWTLIHFVWQGTAIAALAAMLMRFSPRPSTRYATGVAALALMSAAPVVTFLFSGLFPGLLSGELRPSLPATVMRAVFSTV